MAKLAIQKNKLEQDQKCSFYNILICLYRILNPNRTVCDAGQHSEDLWYLKRKRPQLLKPSSTILQKCDFGQVHLTEP